MTITVSPESPLGWLLPFTSQARWEFSQPGCLRFRGGAWAVAATDGHRAVAEVVGEDRPVLHEHPVSRSLAEKLKIPKHPSQKLRIDVDRLKAWCETVPERCGCCGQRNPVGVLSGWVGEALVDRLLLLSLLNETPSGAFDFYVFADVGRNPKTGEPAEGRLLYWQAGSRRFLLMGVQDSKTNPAEAAFEVERPS